MMIRGLVLALLGGRATALTAAPRPQLLACAAARAAPPEMFPTRFIARVRTPKDDRRPDAPSSSRSATGSPAGDCSYGQMSYLCSSPMEDDGTCVLSDDVPGYEGREVWICSKRPPSEEYLGLYWEEMMA